MNIDYVKRKSKPKINAEYVEKVVSKHFPAMMDVLEEINKSKLERYVSETVRKSKEEIQDIINDAQNKRSLQIAKKSLAEAEDVTAKKSSVMSLILRVTDKYSEKEIAKAIEELLAKDDTLELITDEELLTKKTFQKLEKMYKNKDQEQQKKKATKAAKIQAALMSNLANQDDLL